MSLLLLLLLIILISLNSASASDNTTSDLEMPEEDTLLVDEHYDNLNIADDNDKLSDASSNLESRIINAKNKEKITINPGTYKIHNIKLTKNITIQGNGNPRDIIIDGENKSSIFLIRSPDVHVTFKNITFINGFTKNFGGVISIETGRVTVDNCIFINNTALNNTNAGGISNYGTKYNRGYLLVNNSLFINNHADHDGGAITTCYADSYIYNCVFINNSAHRDGGAIRVSVFGFGEVKDCIFMFNHADEWGGAYYSWSGESDIQRCIFLNNTAGTNGGAVMVSGNINIQDSIIMNNNGNETGGSFYIQQPMYNTKTVINVHNNLITNNTSPYGQEVFIKWKDSYNLYTQFDDNDWGGEDPNSSSVIDPNNVTSRSKVSSTIKSDLFNKLNVDLLYKYQDLIKDYFANDSLNELKDKFKKPENNQNDADSKNNETNGNVASDNINNNVTSTVSNPKTVSNQNIEIFGNSSSPVGENDKNSYEINETPSVSKEVKQNLKYLIAVIALTVILLAIGYKRNKKEE
ncbi:hypothetical protein [Methanobrevibacter sp.]|uniref:hypothetical protein n=1 Tax=Methanobrevibacter sp. TaxID=66852 RepID=UPI003863EE28